MSNEEEEAVDAAAKWAQGQRLRPSAFRRAVTGTDHRELTLVRTRWTGERRWVAIVREPSSTRKRNLDAPLDASLFRPWTGDGTSLPDATRHFAKCAGCDDEKKVKCVTCAGDASVRCDTCSGSGRAVSEKTGRIISCRSCRGTGTRKCLACRSGLATCAICEGKGKVEEWAEIRSEPLELLLEGPDGRLQAELGRQHRRGGGPIEMRSRWSSRSPAGLPPEAQELVARFGLEPSLDRSEYRLAQVEVEQYEESETEVTYRIGGAEGGLTVQGWDAEVREDAGSTNPLKRRRSLLFAAVLGGFWLGLAIASAFTMRHPWFSTTAVATAMLWLGAALGPSLGLFVSGQMYPTGTARQRLMPAIPLLLVALAQGTLFLATAPSMERALELEAAGDFAEARALAMAAFDLGVRPAEAAALHDRTQLAHVTAATSASDAWTAAGRRFLTTDAAALARAQASALTTKGIELAVAKGDLAGAATLLGGVPDAGLGDAELQRQAVRLRAAQGQACVEALDGACAEAALASLARLTRVPDLAAEAAQRIRRRANAAGTAELGPIARVLRSRSSLSKRVAQCGSWVPLVDFLETAGTGPDAWGTSRAELSGICAQLLEQQRAEAETARERAERQQARERARRSWSSAPLRCRDGTNSPTCKCGGSRSGCCSHHGGVAGCSQ